MADQIVDVEGLQTERETSLRSGARWGPWVYHPRLGILAYRNAYGPGGDYDIPLRECVDMSRALGWVLHMANKRWISSADVGQLVLALRSINGWWSW